MVKNLKQFLFVAGLLMIAAGAQPVGAAIWQWSTTAASNATADPSINWQENMAPSAVNDSARAMMAAIAAWRNDISATNTTGGTASAYTLTTSEGVSTTPSNGQMLSFIAHVGNNASATMQVDGGNTYPIWLNGSAIGSGSLAAGSPYRMAFSLSNGAWMIETGPSNPYNTPLGGVIWTTLATAPNSNFVSANGQCLSTTTYATYWAAIGSPVPGSCAGGQFAVIDLRGRVVAGLDTLPGSVAANRMTSASNGCGATFNTMGSVCSANQNAVLAANQVPTITSSVSASGSMSGTTSSVAISSVGSSTGGGGFGITVIGSMGAASVSVSGSVSGSATSTNTGGATPTGYSTVQPTMGLYPWVRVL